MLPLSLLRRWLLAVVFIPALLIATPSAIVKDMATGNVLLSEDPDARHYPASLTKVMTLYLLFDDLESGKITLEQKFSVSIEAAAQPPTKVGLRPGSRISVEECIGALILRSANDVAVVVAEGLAGSESAFAARMTAKAKQLGMHSTVFRNASGLPDDEQYTTANDLMILTDTLITRFPERYHYFGMTSCKVAGQMLTTHNGFLGMYKDADGLKTGYTREAGYNLIASVERKGHRLVGIELGEESRPVRDARMVHLMDHAFGELGIARESVKPERATHRASVEGKHSRLRAAAREERESEDRPRARRGAGRGHSQELAKAERRSHTSPVHQKGRAPKAGRKGHRRARR
jgi:D-alanyl-D-alanine carboxypeptidase